MFGPSSSIRPTGPGGSFFPLFAGSQPPFDACSLGNSSDWTPWRPATDAGLSAKVSGCRWVVCTRAADPKNGSALLATNSVWVAPKFECSGNDGCDLFVTVFSDPVPSSPILTAAACMVQGSCTSSVQLCPKTSHWASFFSQLHLRCPRGFEKTEGRNTLPVCTKSILTRPSPKDFKGAILGVDGDHKVVRR